MEDRVVSYAQNREDVLLAGFFPEDYEGFYVDVGANHPIYDSVTKYFYERGWRGINIEPNARLFELLEGDRSEDVNLKIGISSKPGKAEIRIYDNGDGLSTLSKEMQQSYIKSNKARTDVFHEETITLDTLSNVLKKYAPKHGIDFMKIDVEGLENEVILGNDWFKYRPRIICIESNHMVKNWEPMLKDASYTEVFFDGLNKYFASKEFLDKAKEFSYEKSILGRNIVSLKWNQELLHQASVLRRSEIDKQALIAQNAEAERRVAYISGQLDSYRHFKVLFKALLLKIDEMVQLRIARFDKPKSKVHSKHILIDDQLIKEAGKSKPKILALVRDNDYKNFYSDAPLSKGYKKSYSYTFANAYYVFSRRSAVFVIRGLLKIRRVIKGVRT